jgi:1-deoxy-D-xylulose-5-phosphate reductoisomerase
MKKIVILGSTGSIGVNALDIVRRLGRSWRVFGLSAQNNTDRLMEQALEFKPSFLCVSQPESARKLRETLKPLNGSVRILTGPKGLEELASHPQADLVLSAVVGSAGLKPLVAAVKKGKTIALANKEALIVAGDLIMKLVKRHRATLLPVDSEHSAIFQCLRSEPRKYIRRIVITASGGPFYKRQAPLDSVTAEEALAHPTWKMGKKITIDSATLMNKGLEVIEAHHLFGVPYDQIDIVIHPQSIVHSLVEFTDGAVLAQLSHPDMRLPIQYALTHPERQVSPIKTLDLEKVGKLEFYPPDFKRFPCLGLALAAGRQGGTMPTVLSAANEAAVGLFLAGRISFTDIPKITEEVIRRHRKTSGSPDLDEILEADAWARTQAQTLEKVYA